MKPLKITTAAFLAGATTLAVSLPVLAAGSVQKQEQADHIIISTDPLSFEGLSDVINTSGSPRSQEET